MIVLIAKVYLHSRETATFPSKLSADCSYYHTVCVMVTCICTDAWSHGNILLLRHMSVGDRFPHEIGFSQDFRSEITGV